ncbi:MAG TPA: glycosyltransferase family 4 protein, partial [Candidatus Acidoferrum sp.]|nr:glycosyltransferase family 4 protein [Candidatus Acidoferrum sp.]
AAAKIATLLRSGRFDLLHLNEPHALTAAWLAGAHRRVRLLLSRRIGFPLGKSWVSQARYRAVTRFLPNSVTVAQSLLQCGIAHNRISVVNEGVAIPPLTTAEQRAEARRHWSIHDEVFLFGCVSVFVPEKGQRHAIEALARLREKHPTARLFLAGDGPCRGEIAALTAKLAQTEAVLMPGFVQDVDSVYAALDGFVFPSEFEGLGTALQAAMALAIPSISTARGALGEVVTANKTALVVEPDGAAFAAAMQQLMEDGTLRHRLGEAGRKEIAERFSAERMVANTLRIYESVLQQESKA